MDTCCAIEVTIPAEIAIDVIVAPAVAAIEVIVSNTGSPGPQGDTGPQGEQGPQGDIGLTGATGAQGPQGVTGATGAQGPQGDTGLTGATGATGAQGVAGATGAQGPQGTAGATGATGAQGPQGVTGATGTAGAQGIPGTAGATGPAGPSNIIHTTAGGAGGTDLTVGSVTDGQILLRSGANVIGATIVAANDTAPYWRRPASGIGSAFDDEFDAAVSADGNLANRGWSVSDSNGNPVTYAGPIQVWTSGGTGFVGAPAAATYRCSIIGSCAFVQMASGMFLRLYKAVNGATPGSLFARMWWQGSIDFSGTSSGLPAAYLFGWNNTAGKPGAVGVYSGLDVGTGGDVIGHAVGTTTGSNANTNWQFGSNEGFFIRWPVGAGEYLLGQINGNGQVVFIPFNNAGLVRPWNSGPNPLAFGGVEVRSNSTGFTRTPRMIVIDFIRYIPGDLWLAN